MSNSSMNMISPPPGPTQPLGGTSSQHQIRPSTIRSLSEGVISIDRAKRCINATDSVTIVRQQELAIQNAKPAMKNNHISLSSYMTTIELFLTTGRRLSEEIKIPEAILKLDGLEITDFIIRAWGTLFDKTFWSHFGIRTPGQNFETSFIVNHSGFVAGSEQIMKREIVNNLLYFYKSQNRPTIIIEGKIDLTDELPKEKKSREEKEKLVAEEAKEKAEKGLGKNVEKKSKKRKGTDHRAEDAVAGLSDENERAHLERIKAERKRIKEYALAGTKVDKMDGVLQSITDQAKEEKVEKVSKKVWDVIKKKDTVFEYVTDELECTCGEDLIHLTKNNIENIMNMLGQDGVPAKVFKDSVKTLVKLLVTPPSDDEDNNDE